MSLAPIEQVCLHALKEIPGYYWTLLLKIITENHKSNECSFHLDIRIFTLYFARIYLDLFRHFNSPSLSLSLCLSVCALGRVCLCVCVLTKVNLLFH